MEWITAGPLAVRRDASAVVVEGRDVDLTAAQARVLVALMRRHGRLASRDEIYREVVGRDLPRRSRAIDLHVARIRSALGPHASAVVTVGRVGYRIATDVPADTTP